MDKVIKIRIEFPGGLIRGVIVNAELSREEISREIGRHINHVVDQWTMWREAGSAFNADRAGADSLEISDKII
jgi:hypothetical protein